MGDYMRETDRAAFGSSENDSLRNRDAKLIIGRPQPWRAKRLSLLLRTAFCEAEHFREAHGLQDTAGLDQTQEAAVRNVVAACRVPCRRSCGRRVERCRRGRAPRPAPRRPQLGWLRRAAWRRARA